MKFNGQTLSFFYLLVGIPGAFSNENGLRNHHGNAYEPLPAGESIKLSDSRSHSNEAHQPDSNTDVNDYEPLPAGETMELSDSRSHSNEARQPDSNTDFKDYVPLPAGESIELDSRSHSNGARQPDSDTDFKDYEPLPAGETMELSDSRSHSNGARQPDSNTDFKDYVPLPAGESIESDSRSDNSRGLVLSSDDQAAFYLSPNREPECCKELGLQARGLESISWPLVTDGECRGGKKISQQKFIDWGANLGVDGLCLLQGFYATLRVTSNRNKHFYRRPNREPECCKQWGLHATGLNAISWPLVKDGVCSGGKQFDSQQQFIDWGGALGMDGLCLLQGYYVSF